MNGLLTELIRIAIIAGAGATIVASSIALTKPTGADSTATSPTRNAWQTLPAPSETGGSRLASTPKAPVVVLIDSDTMRILIDSADADSGLARAPANGRANPDSAVQVAASKGKIDTAVHFVRNDGERTVAFICARTILRTTHASKVARLTATPACDSSTKPRYLAAKRIDTITTIISGAEWPGRGFLELELRDSASAAFTSIVSLPLVVQYRPVARRSTWAYRVAWAPFGLGALAVLFAAILARKSTPNVQNAEVPPAWDGASSWASNLGVAGGVMSTLLALALLPDEPRFLSKSGYPLLGALFTAISTLAPLMYRFFYAQRVGKPLTSPKAAVAAAGLFTVSGAFGQIGITVLLLYEFKVRNILPFGSILPFVVLLSVLAAVLFIYAWRSMFEVSGPKPSGLEMSARISGERYTLL